MILYYSLRWLAIVALGLLVYGRTFHYGFVFDDYIFVVTNPFIKNFTNFPLMWHTFPMTRFLGMYTFSLNYHLNQFNPFGYHLFNFSIHLASTGLVWALAALIFRLAGILPSRKRLAGELPLIVALLFLVHPGQTQAVTYITQRYESMATMFYLGAVYAYLRGRLSLIDAQRFAWWVMAGFSMLLGMLTKEVVITVPVMILAIEWIFFPNTDRRKVQIVVLAAGALLTGIMLKLVHTGLGVLWRSYPSESHDGDFLTPGRYFLTQLRVFMTFLRLLLFPLNQNLDYDYPASMDFFHPPSTLIGAVMMAAMIFLIVKLRRKWPVMAFGLAWMLITFSVNFVPRSNVIFEHKLYLISFGYFLVLAGLGHAAFKDQATLLKSAACLVIVLAFLAFLRNGVWANELTLWQDGIQKSPNKARVNASLGRVYGNINRYDKAIEYLSRSIALSPDNITYENRGVIYSLEGRMDKALADLNMSIKMDPAYFITYTKRAWVYFQLHDNHAAMADLASAIELDPYFPDSYLERGIIFMDQGRYNDAIGDFEKVLQIDPQNAVAAAQRSACLLKMQK